MMTTGTARRASKSRPRPRERRRRPPMMETTPSLAPRQAPRPGPRALRTMTIGIVPPAWRSLPRRRPQRRVIPTPALTHRSNARLTMIIGIALRAWRSLRRRQAVLPQSQETQTLILLRRSSVRPTMTTGTVLLVWRNRLHRQAVLLHPRAIRTMARLRRSNARPTMTIVSKLFLLEEVSTDKEQGTAPTGFHLRALLREARPRPRPPAPTTTTATKKLACLMTTTGTALTASARRPRLPVLTRRRVPRAAPLQHRVGGPGPVVTSQAREAPSRLRGRRPEPRPSWSSLAVPKRLPVPVSTLSDLWFCPFSSACSNACRREPNPARVSRLALPEEPVLRFYCPIECQ